MDVATGLGVARSIWDVLRSGHVHRVLAVARGRWPLSASLRPSDVYTGFGLITTVLDRDLPREITIAAVDSVRSKELPIVPATLVVVLRNETHSDVRIEELILLSRQQRPVPDLSDWTAIAYNLPGAGGRGEEARFSVWFARGLTAPIPLLARAAADGADVVQPRLRSGETYGVVLDLYPEGPGSYIFDVYVRSSMGSKVIRQLVAELRLLDLGTDDYGRFGRVIRLLMDMQVDTVTDHFPERDLRARLAHRDTQRVVLSGKHAFKVDGHASPSAMHKLR